MNDEPRKSQLETLFPPPDTAPPRAAMWKNIRGRIDQSDGLSKKWWLDQPIVLRWGMALCGLAAFAALGLLALREHPASKQGTDWDAGNSLARAADLESWVQAHRPGQYARHRETLAAIEDAIADTNRRLMQSPDDPRLIRRAQSYLAWKVDVLKDLAGPVHG